MRPITRFAIEAAIGLALVSGAAAAATGVGETLFGSSDASTQGGTAQFTGSGGGSVATSAVPVGGGAAAGVNGRFGAGPPAPAAAIGDAVPAAAIGDAASIDGKVTTSGNVTTSSTTSTMPSGEVTTSVGVGAGDAHAGGSAAATASVSSQMPGVQTPSLGSVIGAVDGVARPVTSAVSNALPFSTGGGAPMVGMDVSSSGQSAASVR